MGKKEYKTMFRSLAVALVVVAVASAGTEFNLRAVGGNDGPKLVPMPQSVQAGSTRMTVSSSLKFTTEGSSVDFLNQAYSRYADIIFNHGTGSLLNDPALTEVAVKVASTDETLQLGTDESYTLSVNPGSAVITAKTVYGALRALETFSQLISFDFDSEEYVIMNSPIAISDAPRFQHRGVLVDTSRHWQSIPSLKRVIDSLSYAKLNVLHWHIVDSQAFPYPSKLFPKVSAGAYSNFERYTLSEIKDIIEYSRLRGIRVMIEFDVPGHASSWGNGYPELWPSSDCREPLDPSKDTTWKFLDGLLSEAADIFPDGMFHLGGDEVNTDCWTKTAAVAKWMADNKLTAEDTYMKFVETAHEIVAKKNRDPVNWEEVFNHFGSKLDKKTIVHIWLDHATLAKVVAAGYRALLSNSDVWYLDHLDVPMDKFYLNEPFDGITDPDQQKLVLGGEVCMWGETVDVSDINQTIWPRAAAAAERLWSPQAMNNVDEFTPRYNYFRCLLNSRGIEAAPSNNKDARTAPPGPGSCLSQ